MLVMRCLFTRGAEVRYMSHLDTQRLFGRALRRGKIPVKFSQGFNPHPKLSFASALGVGTTSDSEFIDIELDSEMSLHLFSDQLTAAMPTGFTVQALELIKIEENEKKPKALMSLIRSAIYEITLPDYDAVHTALNQLVQYEEWQVKRFSKKKDRLIDIKPHVFSIEVNKNKNNNAVIRAHVAASSEVNVRPDELVKVLVGVANMPEMAYAIHRKRLIMIGGE